MGSLGGSDSKGSSCNAGDLGSVPGLRRSPGGGNGNPLQYSCLENPMDVGAWRATVHGVARSWNTSEWLTLWTLLIADLQYCVGFLYTKKWFNYACIYILFNYKLLQDIEYSSLYYVEGTCYFIFISLYQQGVLHYMRSQRAEHDWVNWTELICWSHYYVF